MSNHNFAARATRGIRRAVQESGSFRRRSAEDSKLDTAKYLELGNVPITTTPADIRRLLVRSNVQGIADVAINYKAFSPTRTALVTLTFPDYIPDALRKIHGSMISNTIITASRKSTSPTGDVITGDGPRGGLTRMAQSVIVWGLPFRSSISKLESLLAGFELADIDKPIVKVATPDGQFSRVSRCLVHFGSIAEAHRFVLQVHGTYLDAKNYGSTYPISARVIY
ncbi:hypothetical protein C8J56DRAFT_1167882 [Mycena floridula]|nr:hypothetical protein C8J56DRAFT_1167882 [Mycena floridula]